MKKFALLALLSAGLTGCGDDISDLQEFVSSVKATQTGYVEPMPEVTPFQHEDYVASELRSPFVAPQPELIVDAVEVVKDCLTPDVNRIKEPLEAYAIDNLTMKGTVGDAEGLWALIQTDDGGLFRVRAGYHMGLYFGLVTQVRRDGLDLIELIPDGSGCWVERYTDVTLAE